MANSNVIHFNKGFTVSELTSFFKFIPKDSLKFVAEITDQISKYVLIDNVIITISTKVN